MSIQWDDSYNIGDLQLDLQHKYLFCLANQFLAAVEKKELLDCAARLLLYTKDHFSYEESLMRKLNFPEYGAHCALHNGLIARLEALIVDIDNDTWAKSGLADFMNHWALFHIPRADARLAEYLGYGDTMKSDLAPS